MPKSSENPLKQIYFREIKDALLELENLEKDGFYNIPKITWWILTFEDLAQYCRENWMNDSCFGDLPCSCVLDSPESKFKDLHSSLNEVIQLHEYESYFAKEVATLENVRNDHPALMQWLKKNEKLGTEDFFLFWIEWYEDELEKVKPFVLNKQGLDIKFKAGEWQNTINFLEAFNEFYNDKHNT
ncbi:hypothetical protein [Salegentibacter sp. Hel_I_6]|uniref:hypothetical protein n=1 Tax=Salegentibacter sp. Hel_I_6 TaxID=1250278 RepID=UPI00056860D3|nr:hypothetical protein [Salegentibacter sp. Hel_I_6]